MPDYTKFNDKFGDLEFIRKKVIDSDWITVTGAIDAVTNDITYTPANGKTFFFYSAKIVITGHTAAAASGSANNTANNAVEADLKVNGVVKDTTNVGMLTRVVHNAGVTGRVVGGTGYGNMGDGRFDVTGLFLIGDGSDEVAIENVLDNGTANATLTGWIEDT